MVIELWPAIRTSVQASQPDWPRRVRNVGCAAPAAAVGVAAVGAAMAAGATKNSAAVVGTPIQMSATAGMKAESSGGPGAGKKATPDQRAKALKENGGKCVVPGCGKPAQHVDHAVARSRNGNNTAANLQGMCAHHNCQKGAMSSGEYTKWLQEQGQK